MQYCQIYFKQYFNYNLNQTNFEKNWWRIYWSLQKQKVNINNVIKTTMSNNKKLENEKIILLNK